MVAARRASLSSDYDVCQYIPSICRQTSSKSLCIPVIADCVLAGSCCTRVWCSIRPRSSDQGRSRSWNRLRTWYLPWSRLCGRLTEKYLRLCLLRSPKVTNLGVPLDVNVHGSTMELLTFRHTLRMFTSCTCTGFSLTRLDASLTHQNRPGRTVSQSGASPGRVQITPVRSCKICNQ